MCLESNCSPYPIDGERWRWRGDLERRGELELNGKKFERFMSRDYIRRIFSQSGEKRIEICKSVGGRGYLNISVSVRSFRVY